MNKKLVIFFVIIMLVVSIYFITSFSFRTGTYVEMFPAFSGTVCILQDGNCVVGTNKLLNEFALAKIWSDEEAKLMEQQSIEQILREDPRRPVPAGRPLIVMIAFDGVRYYGDVSGEDTEEISPNERNLTIEFAKKITVDRSTLNFSDSSVKAAFTPPKNIRVAAQIFILNQDGNSIETDKLDIVFAGNSTKVRELSINLDGQIYTLISIEKQVTEPITYTF